MTPRDYQQAAHDAAIAWIKQSLDPCVLQVGCGGGKSFIVAMLSETIRRISDKKTLCLQPTKELLEQNAAKYKLTGQPYSLFSASVGARSTRHPVVFATPMSVKNHLRRFSEGFGAVIIDEAHQAVTPTMRKIVETMREENPNLRVIGMTATPFRTKQGYIYEMGGTPGAYFKALVYCKPENDLIDEGYLCPPAIGQSVSQYDTSGLELASTGKFTSASVDRAFVGHGRLTSQIVADVVEKSRDRNGVMLFGATIEHAEEILASLPPDISAIVTGKTPKLERQSIIARFVAGRLKYLVNVAVLTTGFDAPHCDVIALLRRTESPVLLQQILGRGTRLNKGKADFLVLDYAGNIEEHCPDGDLFNPEIVQPYDKAKGEGSIEVTCPLCHTEQEVTARPNPDQYDVSKDGYFLDALDQRVETDEGPIPAHFMRACGGYVKDGPHYVRCAHRWTSKECPHCGVDNDITARRCWKCKGEIIDPNKKLALDFAKHKKRPSERQVDEVVGMDVTSSISRNGNETWKVDFVTPYRSFSIWLLKEPTFTGAIVALSMFNQATDNRMITPKTVTYKKDTNGFYKVLAYNEPAEELELVG